MPLYLVTGATGQQGGATLNALLQAKSQNSDIKIRAMTRNPDSVAALRLVGRDVEVVKGDLGDRESILLALKNVNVAYLVTDFTGPGGVEAEVEQGLNFVDCVKESEVTHIVFSSVAGADIAPNVPHFHSKFIIENHIKSSGIPYTFVRPTSFMENIPPPGIGRLMFLSVMKSILGTSNIYHIAAADIGQTVAQAMLKPEQNKNRIINTVGEIANPDEMKSALDRAEGYAHWRIWLPRWLIMATLPKEFHHMFTFLSDLYARDGMPGTVEELTSIIPEVTNLEKWATTQKPVREEGMAKKDL